MVWSPAEHCLVFASVAAQEQIQEAMCTVESHPSHRVAFVSLSLLLHYQSSGNSGQCNPHRQPASQLSFLP